MKKLISFLIILIITSTFSFSQEFGTSLGREIRIQSQIENINAISPVVTETGFISLSVDGLGTLSGTGVIKVDKPAGATVRSAFLAMAQFPVVSGGPLNNGDIKINDIDVVWNTALTVPQVMPFANASNQWADVTTIVKPIVDAAASGIIDLTITEVRNADTEGTILAVIFDDPNQTTINTVILLYGAQSTTGDNFAIGLAEPINISDPNLVLDFSLGISFGFQTPDVTNQVVLVDVNGQRLTSSAGGQNDGEPANGALITVGGIGDSNNNPPPFAAPTNFDFDDELYNLIPFVTDGATSINVFTINPSNDDNVFFAAMFLGATTAIVGEGILLSPASATRFINTNHTVTAKVQDNNGDPVVGRQVDFEIVSGPNAGLMSTGVTNAQGEVSYTYSSAVTGTDEIEASMTSSTGGTVTSNSVTVEWKEEQVVEACPFSQGYWRNHPAEWPESALPMTLGTTNSYNKTQLLRLFDAAVSRDASLILAHQLIAAKLNVANGSPVPSEVQDAIADADDAIAAYSLPAGIRPNSALGQTMTSIAKILDMYNNRLLTPECLQEEEAVAASQVNTQSVEGIVLENYPNPFNPVTQIRFSIPENNFVTLKVYNAVGQLVRTLVNENLDKGYHSIEWNATDESGNKLSSGIYLYRVQAGDQVQTSKMILMK